MPKFFKHESDKSTTSASSTDWDSLEKPAVSADALNDIDASLPPIEKHEIHIEKTETKNTLSEDDLAYLKRAGATEAQCEEIAHRVELFERINWKLSLRKDHHETIAPFTDDEIALMGELSSYTQQENIKTGDLPFEFQQALIIANLRKERQEKERKATEMIDKATKNLTNNYAEYAKADREKMRESFGLPPEDDVPATQTGSQEPKKEGFFSRFRKK